MSDPVRIDEIEIEKARWLATKEPIIKGELGMNISTGQLRVFTGGSAKSLSTETLNNVKDFGATGDGVTDDRVAIQAAIADAVANSTGGILLPAGDYIVGHDTANKLSININGLTNFAIVGVGPASKLKFDGVDATSIDWSLFRVHGGAMDITIRDLTFDGNKANVTNPSADTRLIFVEDATDIEISRVTCEKSPGRGVEFGSTTTSAKRCAVRDSRIIDCADRGAFLTHGLECVVVDSCFFRGNTAADISFEPSTTGTDPFDLVIANCFVDKAGDGVGIDALGLGASNGPDRIWVLDTLVFGEVSFLEAQDVRFRGGEIRTDVVGITEFAVVLQNVVERISFVDVRIDAPAAGAVSLASDPQEAKFLGCDFFCGPASGQNCFAGKEADQLMIDSCRFFADSGSGSDTALKFVVSGGDVLKNCAIRNNQFIGTWTDRIIDIIATAGTVKELAIHGNQFEGTPPVDGAIALIGTFSERPIIHGNRSDAGIRMFRAGSVTASAGIVVGGNTELEGGARFIFDGTPESALVGNLGDICSDINGGAGTTLYVKESGVGTNTGWVAK